MLSSALALSILSVSGFMAIYLKLPRGIRKWMERHSLFTDMMSLIAVYYMFGGTLTALLAGAMCGLMISAMLEVVNHKERYLYLYDMCDAIKRHLSSANNALIKYGQEYREKTLPQQ